VGEVGQGCVVGGGELGCDEDGDAAVQDVVGELDSGRPCDPHHPLPERGVGREDGRAPSQGANAAQQRSQASEDSSLPGRVRRGGIRSANVGSPGVLLKVRLTCSSTDLETMSTFTATFKVASPCTFGLGDEWEVSDMQNSAEI